MELILIVGISLIVLGVVGIIYAIRYNKIIIDKLKMNEAEVNIDETLRNKFDNILRTISIIEKKTKIESKTFEELKRIKSDKLTNFEIDRLLSKCTQEILVITEDYPKVREVKNYNELLKDIEDNETHLIALRSYYNKYTFQYNRRIKTFPDTVICKVHGFSEQPYYDGKNLNDEIYTDFKI